jgi:hypothetical protein
MNVLSSWRYGILRPSLGQEGTKQAEDNAEDDGEEKTD